MDKRKIGFIGTTAVVSLVMVAGGIADIVQPEPVVQEITKLGLPLHMMTLIGVWKVLGGIALARPQMRRINEWAYAGVFFDLTGAAYLHAAVGDIPGVPAPLFFAALLIASYRLRPDQSVEMSSGSQPIGGAATV